MAIDITKQGAGHVKDELGKVRKRIELLKTLAQSAYEAKHPTTTTTNTPAADDDGYAAWVAKRKAGGK